MKLMESYRYQNLYKLLIQCNFVYLNTNKIYMSEKRVLITFSIESRKFESNYERNKFFRGLYGWKQIIKKQEKKYVYRRHGLLDEIPHIKVDQSLFIIAKKHLDRMEKFLDEWEDKVKWDKFEVLLREEHEKILRRFFENGRERKGRIKDW